MTEAERKLLLTLGQAVMSSQLSSYDIRSRVAGLMADVEREAGISAQQWFYDQAHPTTDERKKA